MVTGPRESRDTQMERNSTEGEKKKKERICQPSVCVCVSEWWLYALFRGPHRAIRNFNSNFGSFEICKMDIDTDLYARFNAGECSEMRE